LLYVEVKGTQGAGLKILLTSGEVHFNAEHGEYMALFVVSEILLSPDLSPSGGVTKIVCPWHIEAASLTPIGFSCTV
jgi:hypothetical protein